LALLPARVPCYIGLSDSQSQGETMSQTESRDAKRARFGAQQIAAKPRGASPLVLIAGLVVVLAVLGSTIYALSRPSTTDAAAQSKAASGLDIPAQAATQGHEPYPLVTADSGSVRLPVTNLDDGVARFYTLMVQGRPVEFFVLKDKSGTVRAALNACEVCFPAKKGYHQEGDEMICNNCGRRFPINQIGLVHGGCNPSPLNPAVDGSSVVIQENELAAGLSMF
jgi:hypothetical protein